MDFTKLLGQTGQADAKPEATGPRLVSNDSENSPFIATEVVGGWTGILVNWKLSDLVIGVGDLARRVREAGLPVVNFPKECGPSKALTWAIKDVAKVTDNHIKAIKGTPWTQVTSVNTEVGYDGKRNKYDFDFKAKVVVSTSGVIGSNERVVIEPEDHIMSQKLKERYLWRRQNIIGADVSSSLTGQVIPSLNGIGAPAWDGGRYFIPASRKAEWDEHLAVLDDIGGKFYGIPATKNEGNLVELLTDSVMHEAAQAINELEADLDPAKALGESALKHRIDNINGMLAKVSSYEEMLGVKLTGVKRRIGQIGAKVTEAQMVLLTVKASK